MSPEAPMRPYKLETLYDFAPQNVLGMCIAGKLGSLAIPHATRRRAHNLSHDP
jgi:hypothetical protein